MSEIQVFADPNWVRWIIAGLVSAVSALIIYIWRSMKKDIDEIKQAVKENKIKQDTDHDRLDKVETKVNIYHPEMVRDNP